MQSQRPDIQIIVLGDSTPIPHADWAPEMVDWLRETLPDLDLTQSLEELSEEELWSLVEVTENTAYATPSSSRAWVRQVLSDPPVRFHAALHTIIGEELTQYILSAM